ncbi:addiction module antidote protein [Polycladidibacter hongkongensis]|uniref:addiction module antidote protein n=1 Tax=Polycladidibacter hongkongensis TaxID=1647556 RepID=UPI00082A68AE|nr:addiction module antidote protein [Pseudovibrio hongkongensis]
MKNTSTFDAADYLETNEDIACFLADAFESGDPAHVTHALGVVARVRGMAEIAEKAQLNKTSLYRSLGEKGNPTIKTLMAIMSSVGVQLSAKPITD